jgi:adenosylcobinamide-GDP ribazoletransferase
MRPLLAAIQFLTVIPVPSRFQTGEEDLRRSLVCFPIVGLMLGAMLAVLDPVILQLLPLLPASVFLVIGMLALSGCLHMDGLADTADGFLSSRPKERMLEIMRDSRIGPMGVIAIVCGIALKTAALSSIPGPEHWRVVFLMPLAGRCALVFGMKAAPYARGQGGLASVFGRPGWLALSISAAVLTTASWLILGRLGAIAAGLVAIATLIFSFWCRQKIGGFTGDTLGAACEIAEIIPALAGAALGGRL